jgi:uncharacterized protein YecE (DUF72 family)
MRPQDIKIGTSGWRFADWAGTFYPLRVPQTKWLEYYAARFSVGEINSTYYRIPPAKSFATINAKTPDGFEILAKVHGDVTHARKDVADSMQRLLASLMPLRESKKLIGLLAQFPTSFHFSNESARYLEGIRDLSSGIPLSVEFRHHSWDCDEAVEQIRSAGLTWVSVDEPALDGLMLPRLRVTSEIAYVRLHGRNTAAWYNRTAGDRYDYDYSEQELEEWGQRILAEENSVRRAYVLFNNCYHGQAPRNAQWLMKWMGQKQTAGETRA